MPECENCALEGRSREADTLADGMALCADCAAVLAGEAR